MFAFLLILLILDGLLLTVVVLLQSGKGDGLAAMGGSSSSTDSVIGGRQAATLLTKASWIGGGVFLALALMLSILSSRAQSADSILRQEFQQGAPAAPQPIVPGTVTPDDGAATIPGTEPAAEGTEPAAGTGTPDGQ